MSSSNQIRWGGLAAMLGGLLGIAYFPFHAVAYFATEDGAASLEAPWVAAWAEPFGGVFVPFFDFAPPDDVYTTYGKVYLFVALGMLAGTAALHVRQAPRAGRLERWGFRVAFAGAVLLTLGGLGEYWVGALDFSFLAFSVPGFLLTMFGSTLLGVGTLRAGVMPGLGAWLLAVGGFPGIILMTVLSGHLSGGLLLLDLAWVALGYALFSEGGASTKRPVPAKGGEQE